MAQFKLPDLGEGVAEAEIERWLVQEGDVISEDDALVEVITDKATAEIPSPYAGVVERIHVPQGEVAPVGAVLVTISPPPSAGDGGPGRRAAVGSAAASAPPQREGSGPGRRSSRPRATPPVRKLARALGVDLSAVQGSGPGGRILRSDVEAYAGGLLGPGPAEQTSFPPAGDARGTGAAPATSAEEPAPTHPRREPLRGVRRAVAARMAEAHRVVPAVTHVEECDVTELDATRRAVNDRAQPGVRLTYLPFVIKAVVAGLKRYPALNASLDEAASAIVYHNRYDIGVAIDTPAGLVVPVLRNADAKSIPEIAAHIDGLATSARQGRLTAEELRHAMFTVTSPGPFGGLMATPIVYQPQSAILGVHRATERPVVRNGQIVIRRIMNLSITFDHRVLDGMTAARFALDVAGLLEHPAALLLES